MPGERISASWMALRAPLRCPGPSLPRHEPAEAECDGKLSAQLWIVRVADELESLLTRGDGAVAAFIR
jgi:hypothetical protein